MRPPRPARLFPALLILVAAPASAGPPGPTGAPLTPAEATERVGKPATVEFVVKSVGLNSDGFTELFSEKSWKTPGCFFVRLGPKAVKGLAAKGVATPDDCQGETIRATGTVRQLDFGSAGTYAAITVTDPTRLEVTLRPKPYTPTAEYERYEVRGRTILVHPALQSRRAERTAALTEMGVQLGHIDRTLPESKFEPLRKVRYWLEVNSRPKGGTKVHANAVGLFHPTRGWLRDHDLNPDKAGDIEIPNAALFTNCSARGQTCILLHELAHAHHYHVLGSDHAGVKAAYGQAMERKTVRPRGPRRRRNPESLRGHELPGILRRTDRGVLRPQRLLPVRPQRPARPRPGGVRSDPQHLGCQIARILLESGGKVPERGA